MLLKSSSVLTGRLLLSFPVRAIRLGRMLLRVNYDFACFTLARILLMTSNVLVVVVVSLLRQFLRVMMILVLFRTGLITRFVVPLRLGISLHLKNLTLGMSGLKGVCPGGRLAKDSVFTAWLRKLFRVVHMAACLARCVIPNVVLPVLALEP